jgi:hypothetical protein
MKRLVAALVVAGLAALLPPPAGAQGLGIGPRLSFVRGNTAVPDSQSARYWGAMLRARMSAHTALEVSIDHRSSLNALGTERVRDMPIQGSLLLFPVRAAIAPYLLGGVGWYKQRIQTLEGDAVQATVTTSKFGYHAGLGAELQVGRHAALHLDYRYTLIHRGQKEGEDANGAVPLPGLSSVQQRLKLSHEGSMWTTGLTIYF